MYNYFVLCERNSSYNSILIFFKLSRCFVRGPKICMWFGSYSQINLFCYFRLVNLVVLRHLRYNDWVLCELNCSYSFFQSFWNFAGVLFMVWRLRYGLDMIVKNLLLLFQLVNIFGHLRCNEWVLSESKSSYNFIPIFLKRSWCIVHGLKMCIWFWHHQQLYISDFHLN